MHISKHLYVLVFLSLCSACAETIDSPDPTANVPNSPWVLSGNEDKNGAEVYAACASCHMADASGRSDGLVPRLAGQSEKVLFHKLQKLRNGKVTLPVMLPFARALSESELDQVVHYISRLPSSFSKGIKDSSTTTSSNKKYAKYCSACHGDEGQGNDVIMAPKLCGQHAAYLERRLSEIESDLRGDADLGMVATLKPLNTKTRTEISQWLASGQCVSESKQTEQTNEK